jgi:predicted RNase H-like HicB family nuclease
MTYAAVIKQSGFDWIGWIEEVPGVNCQESTREELRVNILIPFNLHSRKIIPRNRTILH